MKKFHSVFCVICVVFLCFGAVSCSKEPQENPQTPNHEEISSKYDEIAKDIIGDKPIDSGVSVLGNDFSVADFTFTSPDDTIAFSLDKNSFAKLLAGGTFFNYIAPGSEVVTYAAGFKTARGLSLGATTKEFLAKYKIADASALYKKPDDSLYYNPANGVFSGKLTALFASEDSLSYTLLTDDDVQKFLSVRDLKSDGTYMDPKVVTDEFSKYQSIVSMDITADEAGVVSEVAIYKFDK